MAFKPPQNAPLKNGPCWRVSKALGGTSLCEGGPRVRKVGLNAKTPSPPSVPSGIPLPQVAPENKGVKKKASEYISGAMHFELSQNSMVLHLPQCNASNAT